MPIRGPRSPIMNLLQSVVLLLELLTLLSAAAAQEVGWVPVYILVHASRMHADLYSTSRVRVDALRYAQ